MPQNNRQVRLAARPSGLPRPADWEFTSELVPDPGPGEFVVAVSHLSIDPAMRGWMNAGRSYIAPVEIGGFGVSSKKSGSSVMGRPGHPTI